MASQATLVNLCEYLGLPLKKRRKLELSSALRDVLLERQAHPPSTPALSSVAVSEKLAEGPAGHKPGGSAQPAQETKGSSELINGQPANTTKGSQDSSKQEEQLPDYLTLEAAVAVVNSLGFEGLMQLTKASTHPHFGRLVESPPGSILATHFSVAWGPTLWLLESVSDLAEH